MLVSNIQFTKYSSGLIHLENELGRSKTSYDVWGRDRGEGLSIVKTGMCREEYWLWMVHTHTRTHTDTQNTFYIKISLWLYHSTFSHYLHLTCVSKGSQNYSLYVLIHYLFYIFFYTKIVHFYCGSVFCFCFFPHVRYLKKKKKLNAYKHEDENRESFLDSTVQWIPALSLIKTR